MKCAYVRHLFLLLFSLPWLSCAQPKVTGVWILNAIYDENGEKIFDRNDPKYTLLFEYRASQMWGKPSKNDSAISEGLYMQQYRVWYDNETLTFTEDSLFITYGKGDPRHGKDTTVGTYIVNGRKIIYTPYASKKHDKPLKERVYVLKGNTLSQINRYISKQTWEFIRRE